MSKPGGDPSSGISSGDALILPERHPACRRREAQPGSCAERENLSSGAKGEIASVSNRSISLVMAMTAILPSALMAHSAAIFYDEASLYASLPSAARGATRERFRREC